MFFCKDIFGHLPKALSVKEIKAIPGTSNFLKRALFRTFVLFFLIASRFTPPASRVFPLFRSSYARLGWERMKGKTLLPIRAGNMKELAILESHAHQFPAPHAAAI